jgi:hypothetical protein
MKFFFGIKKVFLEKWFNQTITFPGMKSNARNGQEGIIPLHIYPEIMINIAYHCVDKSIYTQQQNKQVPVWMIEHIGV